MGRIYKLSFDIDNYENLEPLQEMDAKYYQGFDGTSKLKSWDVLKVKRMEPELGRELGDAPGFNIPVFTKRALDCLLPLIQEDVELLPVNLDGEILYGINVTTVINAIDYNTSEYITFSDGKRILAFKKYSFNRKAIQGKHIFKIIDEPKRKPFVSETFYQTVQNNELKGFRLELVDEISE